MEGDAPICKCSGFRDHWKYATNWNAVLGGKKFLFFTFPYMSTPNYLNNLYPPREAATRKFCSQVC